MWPPISSAWSDAPASVNHWLPASSISSVAPVAATFPRSHSRAVLPGVGPGDALGAVFVAGQLAQLLELGDGALRIQRHSASLTTVLEPSDGVCRSGAPPGPGRRGQPSGTAGACSCSSVARAPLGPLGGLSARSASHYGWTHPFTVDATTMPHIHDMIRALFERPNPQAPLSIVTLLKAALFTAQGGGARLRDGRDGRLRDRRRARALAHAPARACSPTSSRRRRSRSSRSRRWS